MLRRLGLVTLIAAGTALIASGAAAQRSAPSAGKPVAPFAIEYDRAETPTLGVPLEMTLLIRPRTPVEALEVALSADEGLSLDASDERLTAAAASPEAPAEWHIVLLPVSEGVQRLRVYAEASIGGERQGRSTVITLHVGASADTSSSAKDDAAPAAVAPAPRSERGRGESERIIRLPSSPRR